MPNMGLLGEFQGLLAKFQGSSPNSELLGKFRCHVGKKGKVLLTRDNFGNFFEKNAEKTPKKGKKKKRKKRREQRRDEGATLLLHHQLQQAGSMDRIIVISDTFDSKNV